MTQAKPSRTSTKKTYKAKSSFPFLGAWFAPGDALNLSIRQAIPLLHQGRITLDHPSTASKKEKANAASRK